MTYLLVLAAVTLGTLETDFRPCADASAIRADTIRMGGEEYHRFAIDGFDGWGDALWKPGEPFLPSISRTYLLPPDNGVDNLEITDETWITLPGRYHLYPRQTGMVGDTAFTAPDPSAYSSNSVFPATPVSVTRQGSAMGYSVATLTGTPLRYHPASGIVEVLTSVKVVIHTAPSATGRLYPLRESRWSRNTRTRGILALVANPADTALYHTPPPAASLTCRAGPLAVSESPSETGNCVDMVIITNENLAGRFEKLADYRTRQGIITVVRTVEWISLHYTGCDLPEKIRNFLRDAHENWGIQAALMGGDDGIVPIRQCNGWEYLIYGYPSYQMPSDDYYGDIDGNWISSNGLWKHDYRTGYLDLCVGRWPVDNQAEFDSMFEKMLLYEQPEEFPEDFARKILLMASNESNGSGAMDMMELKAMLDSSSAIPTYLDEPTELYYPHSLPGGDLCRVNALKEFDAGYNIIIHADHSEPHKLATAGKNALGQYMWDSDFATMSNRGEPSILWTLGCSPGHFDGIDCFAEAGLMTSPATGLVSAIANARFGFFSQKITYLAFCDALFNTGYCSKQYGVAPPDWPLSYLGEAHRASKNTNGISFILLNLLGSPLLQVWRGEPERLQLDIPAMVMVEGLEYDLTMTVTDGRRPVKDATVTLWKKGELFVTGTTGADGKAVFHGIRVNNGTGGPLLITAVKHRSVSERGSTVAAYIPATTYLDVLPSKNSIVSLMGFEVNDDGDGQANPGETLRIFPTAINTGGSTATLVRARLELADGRRFVEAISDASADFPDIGPDSIVRALDPFVVKINRNVPGYSVVKFRVVFRYDDGTKTESLFSLPLYSEDYAIPVLNPFVNNPEPGSVVITMKDMVLVNRGLGEGRDLLVTVGGLTPSAPFTSDTIRIPCARPGKAVVIPGTFTLKVHPDDPESSWLRENFPWCGFDLAVVSDGISAAVRHVDVHAVSEIQSTELPPPLAPTVYEAGTDNIGIIWDTENTPVPAGYYVYSGSDGNMERALPVPVPTRYVRLEGLEPRTRYSFEITAVDFIGRESQPVSVYASTTMPPLPGWPVHLYGNAGGGAAVADVDGDGTDEIVVASSFGKLYFISKNGKHTILKPPKGYDFDRFLGCAVGNVDGRPGNEVVVTCQKHTENQGEERIGILLCARGPGETWIMGEIAETTVNQRAYSPTVAGTPVLFQADDDPALEIALRTRGHFGTPPRLYVWDRKVSGRWENFSPEFPLELLGYFYNAPSAVDYDGDGLQELLVTVQGTRGTGTALRIVDFDNTTDPVRIIHRNLRELDRDGKTARVFGTLACTMVNGVRYIAGAASTVDQSSVSKKIFTYTMDGEGVMRLAWATGWESGMDFFGNVPGPSIGDCNGDSNLDVLYLLNTGTFLKEGQLTGWDLVTGKKTFTSDIIPFNPIMEEGGHFVRSQPVSFGRGSRGGPWMFVGFSTLYCGFDVNSDPSSIEGFPSWSREASWSTPTVCDLDHDGIPELFTVDYSGKASLYELKGTAYGWGWHMYQCNPARTGFLEPYEPALDVKLLPSSRPIAVPIASPSDLSGKSAVPLPSRTLTVTVEVEGAAAIATQGRCPLLEVAAYDSRGHRIGTARTELVNGSHTLSIPLECTDDVAGKLLVAADPENRFAESDEANNLLHLESERTLSTPFSITVPSPSGEIRILLTTPEHLENLNVRVYSVDGRLVEMVETGELAPGNHGIRIPSSHLPPGLYFISTDGPFTEDPPLRIILLGNGS